jgi:hypothetical protein
MVATIYSKGCDRFGSMQGLLSGDTFSYVPIEIQYIWIVGKWDGMGWNGRG